MTSERRFERDLPYLLRELAVGPMPDYRDDIVRRTAGMRQRPAWTFPERWIPMAAFTGRIATTRQVPWRAMALIAILILTLVAAVLIVGSRPRVLPPPFGPAANGLVIYAADGDIYSVDPVTKASRRLVDSPDDDLDPVWSRDGSRFAYRRQTPTGAQIYVVRSDGSGATHMRPDPLEGVVSTSPSNVNISFSPDGAELIVAVQCGRTMIARTDGSGVRELEGVMTNGEIEFRPTGGEIAFTPCDERSIDVVNADGTGLSHVAGPGAPLLYGAPAWSPDGSYLAYHVWDGTAPVWTVRTHIVGADGKGDRPLREVPEGDFDGLPAWSNDGKRIVISQGFDPVMYATVLPINGPNQGVRSTVPLVTGLACCSAFEWAPDDSFVLVMPIDDVSQPAQQMLLDPITGEMRPAPWTTTSPPSWQRLAP